MKINRIVDIFYDKFFTVTKDGCEFGVALSEDGTIYNLKPSCLEEKEDVANKSTLGISNAELQVFLKNHPDFSKQIVTPLHDKRPPDKATVYLGRGVILWGTHVTLRQTH